MYTNSVVDTLPLGWVVDCATISSFSDLQGGTIWKSINATIKTVTGATNKPFFAVKIYLRSLAEYKL